MKYNKMQKYADIYLLQNHSTFFGCLPRSSSGVHKTVTAASVTLDVAQILLSVPETVTTVLCTPDDGYGRRPKHAE